MSLAMTASNAIYPRKREPSPVNQQNEGEWKKGKIAVYVVNDHGPCMPSVANSQRF